MGLSKFALCAPDGHKPRTNRHFQPLWRTTPGTIVLGWHTVRDIVGSRHALQIFHGSNPDPATSCGLHNAAAPGLGLRLPAGKNSDQPRYKNASLQRSK